MPEAVRKSELPIMYIQAARTGLSPWAKDFFAFQLNMLMYSGLGDYERAVLSFQRDLGDQPTGKMTVWQIFQLSYRSEMQTATPPSFVSSFISSKGAEYAFVNGTMTILDDRPAWPINYVKVNCTKAEGYCGLDEIDMQPPGEKDWVYNFMILWGDTQHYKITSWSEDVVQAEAMTLGNACRSTTMDLNFKTKEFYLITKNTGQECDKVLGKTVFEPLKKPRISQILDGEKIIGAEHQAFKTKTYEMLSSEFRARMKKYQNTSSSN